MVHWAEMTLPLGALLGEDVVFEGLLMLDTTCGSTKPFGGASIAFDLRHGYSARFWPGRLDCIRGRLT